MRIRAVPFAHEIHDFVASHERVYVVEQNRDAQLASLLKLDLPADQLVKLRGILHYNGLPIDAESITEEFARQERPDSLLQVTPAMNPANLLTRDHREAVANLPNVNQPSRVLAKG
jgi:hypothetical protein